MNKNPRQTDKDQEKKIKRVGAWVGFLGVIYRLLIIVGLILLVLAISAILLTSMFSLWILVLPASLIVSGIILAWLEFQLHDRYYPQQSKDLDHEDEHKKGHGHM